MGLTSTNVEYITNLGKKIGLNIKYEKFNDIRLGLGGFPLNSIPCGLLIDRRQLKPRYAKHSEYGIIYFRTQQKMIDYINANSKDIEFYFGESGGCAAVNLY